MPEFIARAFLFGDLPCIISGKNVNLLDCSES